MKYGNYNKKYLICLIIIIPGTGCSTSNETITICGNKYDVYKDTDYDYEQKLSATFNILCFHNSRIIAFAYQSAGIRNSDSNLVYTIFNQQKDTLKVTTHYNDKVYGYPHQSSRHYKCIKNGFVSLSSGIIITKNTSRKKMRYLRK